MRVTIADCRVDLRPYFPAVVLTRCQTLITRPPCRCERQANRYIDFRPYLAARREA